MYFENIVLKEKFAQLPGDAILSAYVRDNSAEIAPNRRRPAVVVCPGGAYSFTSDREAEPVAIALLAKGYQVFVLRYTCAPLRYPTQLLQAAASVAYVRKNADKFCVDENSISIMGFSAGGHLAGSLGTMWNDAKISQALGTTAEEIKPNALILSYPVISSGEFAHEGSFDNLTGEDAELREYMSLENRVGEHVPPTFIWHTVTDDVVPVENTLLFANALQANKVPFEMHIFPKGGHGLGLANEECASPNANCINRHVEQWFDLCDKWLKTMFSICD